MRKELGLDVKEISLRCGIAPATWSSWENGRTPHDMAEIVRKIVTGTGVDRDWLMWGASPACFTAAEVLYPAAA